MKQLFEKKEVIQKLAKIKKRIAEAQKPLIFFHDDCDGICSFLIIDRYFKHPDKSYVIVKSLPSVDKRFITKARTKNPDKIIVLDLARIEQSFLERIKTEIIWIDHHAVQEPLSQRIHYFNPRQFNVNIPVTEIIFNLAEKSKELLWIATIGCIADWHIPYFFNEFIKEYPSLVEKANTTKVDEVIFNSPLGKIIRTITFSLLGKSKEAYPYIEHLRKINSPYELLEPKTKHGKAIIKKYEKINKKYTQLLTKLKKEIQSQLDNPIIVLTYSNEKYSFTKILANELIHLYPEKTIIIAREVKDEMRMSLRSKKINLKEIIPYALSGIWGYGGGHENAAGATVKKQDFKLFVQRLTSLSSKYI